MGARQRSLPVGRAGRVPTRPVAGHLEVLRWARTNGCPWDPRRHVADAAWGGHLEVLRWARATVPARGTSRRAPVLHRRLRLDGAPVATANGCPWDSLTIKYASNRVHTEIVQWAKANGCPPP